MKIDDLIREGYDLLDTAKSWPMHGGGHLDRRRYVTASEIWNCHRRIKYDKLHPSTGFPNWGYAERGHVIEAWAVKCIRAAMKHYPEYTLLCSGDDQFSFADGVQSGTPDGVLRLPDYSVEVWDIKSIDPRTNWSKLPKEAHIQQVTQNMDLVANAMDVSVRCGRIIYIDASNLQRRCEYEVPFDTALMREMESKAHLIMSTSPDKLPAEGLYRDECRLCRHTSRCSAAIEAQRKEVEGLSEVASAAQNLFK